MKKVVIHMKKLIFSIILLLFVLNISKSYASAPRPIEPSEAFIQSAKTEKKETNLDIESIYKKQIPLDIKFENNLDPYEQQDNYTCSMSPYPLIRTVMPMYSFKTVIEPGYYLLTPRKIESRYYLLFKERGKVLYSAPIFEVKEVDPDKEYQKVKDPYDDAPFGLKNIFKFLGIISGRRTPIPKAPIYKVDCFEYNDQYYGINIYYKDKLYKTVYKIKNYD